MANELTASVIADMIPLLKAKALLAAKAKANIRNYVSEYKMENGSLVIPKIAALTAAQWNEASTLANSATTVTNATLTSEKWGIQLILSNEAIRRAKSGNTDLLGTYGEAVGNALAFAIETKLSGLFSGFSAGVGTTSSDKLTVAKLADGIASIANGNGDVASAVLVARPLTMADLMVDAKVTSMPTMNPAYASSAFYSGSLLGVPCFTSTSMTVGSNAATSAIFSKTALALGIEAEPSINIFYDFKTDAHYLIGKCEFAAVELNDAHGYYYTVHA